MSTTVGYLVDIDTAPAGQPDEGEPTMTRTIEVRPTTEPTTVHVLVRGYITQNAAARAAIAAVQDQYLTVNTTDDPESWGFVPGDVFDAEWAAIEQHEDGWRGVAIVRVTVPEHVDARECAIAGRVLRGQDMPGAGECVACLRASWLDGNPKPFPRMTDEVILPPAGQSVTLAVLGRKYEVTRTGNDKVVMLRGARGAEYGALPYVEQRRPGITAMFVVSTPGMREPFGTMARFYRVGDRFGWVHS
jgi:hypothetical protein